MTAGNRAYTSPGLPHTRWICNRCCTIISPNPGSCARCVGKAKRVRHQCLEIEKQLFDYDKREDGRARLLQSVSQKANISSAYAAREYRRGQFPGTKRENSVSLGIGDAFLFQTPGHQHVSIATWEIFFLTCRGTHNCASYPEVISF